MIRMTRKDIALMLVITTPAVVAAHFLPTSLLVVIFLACIGYLMVKAPRT